MLPLLGAALPTVLLRVLLVTVFLDLEGALEILLELLFCDLFWATLLLALFWVLRTVVLRSTGFLYAVVLLVTVVLLGVRVTSLLVTLLFPFPLTVVLFLLTVALLRWVTAFLLLFAFLLER